MARPRANRVADQADGACVSLPIDDMPGYLIRRAKQKTAGCFESVSAQHKLTPQQYAILVAAQLYRDMDQQELGGRVGLDGSTLGDVVTRLEQRGLILRRIDGRHRRLIVSNEGQELLARVQPDVQRAQQAILDPLTTREGAQLLRLLSKLVGITNRYHRARVRRTLGMPLMK